MRIVAQKCPPGWAIDRPELMYGTVMAPCIKVGDAPPIVIEENPGGTVTVQFPLPGGKVVTGTVTQAPPPGTPATNETIEKVKAWLNQQTIFAGYENWKVLAVGAGIGLLLKGNK
jgi:hypothetical protein